MFEASCFLQVGALLGDNSTTQRVFKTGKRNGLFRGHRKRIPKPFERSAPFVLIIGLLSRPNIENSLTKDPKKQNQNDRASPKISQTLWLPYSSCPLSAHATARPFGQVSHQAKRSSSNVKCTHRAVANTCNKHAKHQNQSEK